MPRIINAFRGPDPMAQTMSEFGRAIWGDQAGGAIKREQLRALQRENVETEALMGRVSERGAQTMGADPLAQAMIIGGGYDPAEFGQLGLLGAATEFGAADPRTDNYARGTGESYKSGHAAYQQDFTEDQRQANATLAENARQANMKPVEALTMDGMPTWATEGNLAGTQPILSDADRKGTLAGQHFGEMGALPAEEQTYLGADPRAASSRAPFNYRGPDGKVYMTTDGVTDVQTSQPLPPGGARIGIEDTVSGGLTNSTESGLQQDNLALKRFNLLADMADGGDDPNKGLLSEPTRFGLTGTVRDYGQETMQLIGNAAQLFGGRTPQEAIGVARAEAANSGITPELLPELYDPTLPQVDTVWGLIVYQGAAAFAGQSGRSVSDKDVAMFKHILGDPKGFFSSAESMRARLGVARQLAAGYEAINNQTLAGDTSATPPPVQPGAPAAPAPVQPGAVQKWGRGPDGSPIRVQ